MKTAREIHRILERARKVNTHIHTHLCDGLPEMTVANIAAEASANGIDAIILTPHFHKRVSDDSDTLYTDTDENILLMLREEIDRYNGDVSILLSTEADILSLDGDLALSPSPLVERACDLITPTMNYNPLLPLYAVRLTYGGEVGKLHNSGEYMRMAESVGGIGAVLDAMYTCETNAIKNSPYTAMLGHFFAAHSYSRGYTWFGAREEDLSVMKSGVRKLINACSDHNAMIDLTGVHLGQMSVKEKIQENGFLHDFMSDFISLSHENNVPVFPGSDSHGLSSIGEVCIYSEMFGI